MPFTSAVGRAPMRSSVDWPDSPASARDWATLQELALVEGHRVEQVALGGGQVEDVVVEAWDLHATVLVVQRRDQPADAR